MQQTAQEPSLQDAWQAWIDLNIQRGCSAESMLNSMLASGAFDAPAAMQQLAQHGHPQARQVTPPKNTPYIDETPRLFAAPSMTVDDRVVRVTMRVEKPIVALLDGVLTDDECDALIALARPKLATSTAVDPFTGDTRPDARRVSSGTFFDPAETPFIAGLDARLATLMGMPDTHAEGIQVLNYDVSGEYKPHFDYFDPQEAGSARHVSPEAGGQRVSTLIMYLNHVPEGGETIFPRLNLSVVPRKGMGLYFEYTNSFGQVDPRTLHGGAPVLSGEKWIATKWMHMHPRRR